MSTETEEAQELVGMLAPKRTGRKLPDVFAMAEGFKKLPKALKQCGWETMREGQDVAVPKLMAKKDVICLMATSAGKSGVYILPTIACGYRTIVVVPIVALIADQMKGALAKGMRAGAITGQQSDAENKDTLRRWSDGDLQIMFLVAERLQRPDVLQAIDKQVPDLLAVDEAHVIDEWADTFRPAYSRIGEFIERYGDRIQSVLALTATATPSVLGAIRKFMGIPNADLVRIITKRENLQFMTLPKTSGDFSVLSAVKMIPNGGQFLVYAATKRGVEELATYLNNALGSNSVTAYHGSMTPNTRSQNSSDFMDGKVRGMVATNAFGMGIDKPDIRGVIHADYPGKVENYVQESGRASRDGQPAKCICLVDQANYKTQLRLLMSSYPSAEAVTKTFRAIQKMCDANRECRASMDDIAYSAGISPFEIGACVCVLYRFSILKRAPKAADTLEVWLKAASSDAKIAKYQEHARKYGVKGEKNALVVSPGAIAAKLNISSKTVTSNFLAYAKVDDGAYMIVKRPPKEPIELIGGLDLIDFPYLEARRNEVVAKLDKMVEYTRVPDANKADWLQAYFRI